MSVFPRAFCPGGWKRVQYVDHRVYLLSLDFDRQQVVKKMIVMK